MRRPNRLTPYLLVLPATIWVLVFSLWPFLNTITLSFTNARPLRTPTFVGLDNYQEILSDPQVGYALVTCAIYVLACVPLLTLIPLLIAMLVSKYLPGIELFRTLYYFPVIASVVVVGIIWSWMFDSKGVVNQAIEFMGGTGIDFLTNRWWILVCAILLTTWKGLGYYMVVYLAALGNVGRDLHEAAAIDGAGAVRRFWSITVPGVRGAMLLVSALITTSAMRIFSEIYVLTNGSGGPGGQAMSLVMLIKQKGSGLNGQLGYASALSVMLFFLTVGPLLVTAMLNSGTDLNAIRTALRKRRAHREALRNAVAKKEQR
ncbi:sn-glycerol-3-phosphate transport system permease protein ugpA [Actinomyces bovis]|uniref:Sn-glycerol-3-phosphate transport system permease protein ugpA n=1 Tax=Actinomyces bovis TaxID=1658 RepID=A0ABY1VNN1_9ACTO|nr:sugar ABC transporter permease [Actinomyces bovis]SPT53718.1 sn-glycerol-3-phosphate transport system permease protein ugpA [Actinomyces bovis]VEG55867.1 sn-glycerol-3-phosphate transport system permease protein ugpA [Actinomyces israelii]